MRQWLIHTDNLLRCDAPAGGERPKGPRLGPLLATIIILGLAYGAVMGTYSGGSALRGWQMLYSGIKVPLLLLATFALSVPSYYVLNALLGLRADFGDAMRALLATQAALTVILCSMAPFTLVWYAGFHDYQGAVLFNTMVFAAASIAGQVVLRR